MSQALSRFFVPLLGLIALLMLFLKLPEVSNILVGPYCRLCVATTLWIVFTGCGYFSLLIALSLLFPAFPNRYLAYAGLLVSLGVAICLTALQLPNVCPLCLLAHACNILIWVIWCVTPKKSPQVQVSWQVRSYLVLLAPIAVISLFSSLNLTIGSYSLGRDFEAFRNKKIYTGDQIPQFTAQTVEGKCIQSLDREKTVLNFISPDCPHCEAQLKLLQEIGAELKGSHRYINISSKVTPEMIALFPDANWVEDPELKLQKLFQTFGSPSLYIVGEEGTISQIILGIPDAFKETLFQNLQEEKALH